MLTELLELIYLLFGVADELVCEYTKSPFRFFPAAIQLNVYVNTCAG